MTGKASGGLLVRQGLEDRFQPSFCRRREYSLATGDVPAEIQRRLERGDVCHCARHEAKIVSLFWVARDSHMVRYVNQTLTLAADEIYLYDAFTSPEWRGRSILTGMTIRVAHEYRKAGARRALIAIRPENRASAKVMAKLGARPCAQFGYIGPRGVRRSFFNRTGA